MKGEISHKCRRSKAMTQSLNIETLIDQVRLSLEGTAKNALHKLFGPDGPAWGTRFEDLEELAVQIGNIVARQLLQQSLQAQALAPAATATHLCPGCGRPTQSADPEPHPVNTRAGALAWLEPSCSCGHCRKAFFPSEPVSGR
jgi:NADH pyrophosphatase NudC (nudix superfamily)